MTKLVAALGALFLGLALSGLAVAADSDTQQPGQDNAGNATESHDQSTQDQGTSKDDAYMAALKKCDSLGDEQKAKCVAAAKRRFGQM